MPRLTSILAIALLSAVTADQDLITQGLGLAFPSLSTDQRTAITDTLIKKCETDKIKLPVPIIQDILSTTVNCTTSLSLTSKNAHNCIDRTQELFLKYIGLETFTFPYKIGTGDKEVIKKCAKGDTSADFIHGMNLMIGYTVGCTITPETTSEYYKALEQATKENGDLNSRSTRLALQAQCNAIEEFDNMMSNVIKFASRAVDSAFKLIGN